MKTRTKAVLAIILCNGLISVAVSQIILNSNGNIEIRNYANAQKYTYHYGDLHLIGLSGSSYGDLYTNRVYVFGPAYLYGNLTVSGNAIIHGALSVLGSKSFVHPHPTDDKKFIKYVAMESGQALTVARGTAKTVNSQVTISLPEHFSLVTNKDEPITVILTPESAPVLLYNKQKNTKEIVVAMKTEDFKTFGDVEFSYQVTGVRDGFEKQEIVVSEDRLSSTSSARADVQKRIDAYAKKKKAEQELELKNKEKAAQ